MPVTRPHDSWIRPTFLMSTMRSTTLQMIQHEAGVRKVVSRVTTSSKNPLQLVVLQQPSRGDVCLRSCPVSPNRMPKK
eukprot:345034-Amphidinium_carterae.1